LASNDSFDTTILPSIDDDDNDDLVAPLSSGQPSSKFPSQVSNMSQGPSQFSLGSQDSIRDFSRHQDDDNVILREPFRPSLQGRVSSNSVRTPDPEFRMPILDVDAPDDGRRGGNRRDKPQPFFKESSGGFRDERGVRQRKKGVNSPSKRRYMAVDVHEDDDERKTLQDRIADHLPTALLHVLKWFLDVIVLSFRYAQRPLAVLVMLYILFGAIVMTQNMVTKSLSTTLSPICWLPGMSRLNLPFCPFPSGDFNEGLRQPVEFDDLMNVQSKFEQILEKNADTASLPMEMKQSELVVRDLRTLVKHSTIQTRDELVLEFDGYIDVARQTVTDLQRFNTHCGGAVDAIVSINRFTARFIDSLDPGNEQNAQSLVQRFSSWIFYPFTPSDRSFSEYMVLNKYIEHTALVSERIEKLVLEAQALLRQIDKAENHLDRIYDISSQSTASVAWDRDQVFWNLWTFLGGNKAKLHNLSQQLVLLRQIDVKRKMAIAQVSALIVELQGIQTNLEDLRDRVSEPRLLQDPNTKVGPIPISVHIETINEGVERLQNARKRIQAEEDDRYNEALKKGGVQDEMLLEQR
jgi:hypothetical protein